MDRSEQIRQTPSPAETDVASMQTAFGSPIPELASLPEATLPTEAVDYVGKHRKDEHANMFQRLGRSLVDGSKNVYEGIKLDFKNSDNRIALAAVGLGTAAVQGLDRARASVVLVPTIAVNVLESTGSPAQAALAGGATFGAWCLAVGGATTEGLVKYPKTVDKFNESFPSFVDFLTESLPGFDSRPVEEITAEKKSLASRIGGNVLDHLKRGYVASGIGTTAYAGTSMASGRGRADTHKLNANASLDGGIAVGLVIAAVANTITKIGESHPQLALDIQNVASDIRLWYGVALGLIGLQYISNRLNKRKQAKQPTA